MITPPRLLVAACFAAMPVAAQNVSELQVAPPTITIKVGERYGLRPPRTTAPAT
jgi:hypothetical protein